MQQQVVKQAAPTVPVPRILVPVRYAAWLSGELGKRLEDELGAGLAELLPVGSFEVTRLPRGFIVETKAPVTGGDFLTAVYNTVAAMEASIQARYPVFHLEMGPVWTGTLQAVYPNA